MVALTILWSLFPRKDDFAPPGHLLRSTEHPKLFEEIANIAQSLDEPMPAQVYLTGDMNAWVAERGGTAGFGSRRVMGLGLPLLRVLSTDEFRAVLAHEFGHYYGGDTRLGPWVYTARSSMVRTLVALTSDSGPVSLLENVRWMHAVQELALLLLEAYWNLFLRVTQLVSRRQESRADELACHVADARSLRRGLEKTVSMSSSFRPTGMSR
jgi:heat shock protein HtpX